MERIESVPYENIITLFFMFEIPQIAKEAIKNGCLPIVRISISAVKEFISNPRMFYKKYIMLDFGIETSGAMLVGSAVHKALEIAKRFDKNIAEFGDFDKELFEFFDEGKVKEIFRNGVLQTDEIIQIALKHFERLQKEIRIKAIAKRLEKASLEVAVPEFFGDVTFEEVEECLEKIEKQYFEFFPDSENEIFEDDLIAWAVTAPREVCETQIANAVKNFVKYDEQKMGKYTILETEKSLESSFCDDDGEPLLPLKGIIDRIDEVDGKLEIVDYKVVSKSSDPNEVKGNYELQAGAYFVLLKNFLPDAEIRKMKFIEILKDEPKYILPEDPNRKLLQKDLREICEKNGLEWGKYEKNAELTQKLKFAKILVQEDAVKEYEINFEENPHIVETFETMVKVVLTQLAFSAMYEIPFLPNISDFFSGAESYEDFVNEMTGKNIERDKTQADDYDGF